MAGQTISRTPHFALHRLVLVPPAIDTESPRTPGHPGGQALFAVAGCWLGALLPKRWARRAVTRNAIRRQVYAVAAEHSARLLPAAHVVRLRSGFDRAAFHSASSAALKSSVRQELQLLFGQAAPKAAPQPAP